MYNIARFFLCLWVTTLTGCAFRSREKDVLPSLNLVLSDSSTVFNTSRIPDGKPIVMVYFGPECKNYQAQTAVITQYADNRARIQLYLITANPFQKILTPCKSIKVYNDQYFEYFNTMKPKSYPFITVYDRNKKLMAVYEGAINEKTMQLISKDL
jgi:hypothetical protein